MIPYYQSSEAIYQQLSRHHPLYIQATKIFLESSLYSFLEFCVRRNFLFPKNHNPIAKETDQLHSLIIGCGLGLTCHYLAQMGFKTLGIDISDSAIKWAQERVERTGVSFCQGNFLEFTSPQKYDLIVDDHCFHCLVFDRERKDFLTAVYKFLQEGGHFVLETLVYDHSLKNLPTTLILDENEILWKKISDPTLPQSLLNLTPYRKVIRAERLEEDLLATGFKIEYFVIHKNLKFIFEGEDHLPIQNYPSMVRIICSKETTQF